MKVTGNKTCQVNNTQALISRREFIERASNTLLGLSMLLTGGFGIATILKFLQPPEIDLEGRTKLGWLEVGTLNDFNETPKKVNYGDEPVYVYFLKKKLVAFSAICPHVRCIVTWNPEGKPNPRTGTYTYNCPCHISAFDIAGRKLYGPAPRGLYEQKLKIVGNKVFLGGGTPPA